MKIGSGDDKEWNTLLRQAGKPAARGNKLVSS